MERIVLAYSGGLDTTVAVRWLREERGFEVVTLTVDLGSQPDLEQIRARALAAGAVEAFVVDARAEFVEHYCWPALQALLARRRRGRPQAFAQLGVAAEPGTGTRDTRQPQLGDVAGDGGLSGAHAGPSQVGHQILLGGDGVLADQAQDGLLPLTLLHP